MKLGVLLLKRPNYRLRSTTHLKRAAAEHPRTDSDNGFDGFTDRRQIKKITWLPATFRATRPMLNRDTHRRIEHWNRSRQIRSTMPVAGRFRLLILGHSRLTLPTSIRLSSKGQDIEVLRLIFVIAMFFISIPVFSFHKNREFSGVSFLESTFASLLDQVQAVLEDVRTRVVLI